MPPAALPPVDVTAVLPPEFAPPLDDAPSPPPPQPAMDEATKHVKVTSPPYFAISYGLGTLVATADDCKLPSLGRSGRFLRRAP
jgi:hypothetical protein